MEPIDLSIGRLRTSQQLSTRETDHHLEERINQLELTIEHGMKAKEREVKVLEIKIAHEMIDLKTSLNHVISEVANVQQRIDNHEHEMKKLDLQKQALWARMDELRVQAIPLEAGRFLGPIPDKDISPTPITGNESSQRISIENEKAQTPTPADEMIQRPIHECESAQIPNSENENGEISILDKERSQSLTPGNEMEDIPIIENEGVHIPILESDRVQVPILENDRVQIPNLLLDNLNTSLEASVITGERAGLAVKAVDVNSSTEINTVEQESSSNYEATPVNDPSTKSTFSCEICSKGFSGRASLRSHKIVHIRQINKECLRIGIGTWKCIYCKRTFKYAKSCKQHESSCSYRSIEKPIPVSADGNAEPIPTTENLEFIFPDSGVEQQSFDVISSLDSSESPMEIDSELQAPKRRGRSKITYKNRNPVKPPSRTSTIESSRRVVDTTREILWNCVFCQKGFTYSSSYRDRHELRCSSRNHQHGTSTDSLMVSTQENSPMHGKKKDENSLKCNVCATKFSRKHHLRRHMLKHDPQNWIQCPYCAYRSYRIDNLTIHVRLTHSH